MTIRDKVQSFPQVKVLVRNMSERGGPGKLRSYWEDQIHIVVSQKGKDSPVYEVKPERGAGRGRILHRNMLMPCNALPLQDPAQNTVGGQSSHTKKRRQKENTPDQTSEDSESSDEEEHYWTQRLRHHRQQTVGQNVVPPITPETTPHAELSAEAVEFRMEAPVEMLLDNDVTENVATGHDAQEVTQPVQPGEPSGKPEPEPSDTQPCRSQRERRPKETLTYESLGRPTHRVVGLHTNPLYVNTLTPVYGQYRVPWIPPQMFRTHLVYPTLVPARYD